MQLKHFEIVNKNHTHKITLILEHLQSPQNIGLIIRTAEAMGVERIFIISKIFHKLSPKIKYVTRSAEKNIEIIFSEDIVSVIASVKKEGYHLYALEKTTTSIDYKKVECQFPCAIVCGNEVYGVSEEALTLCNEHLHINMYGKNTSLNVAVATSILLAHCI